MNLKSQLLAMIIDQMIDLRKKHYQKTGIQLSNEEVIGRYVAITSMSIDEDDYEEINRRLNE